MNFLAHQYLSFNNTKFRIGNFVADFVRGSEMKDFSNEVITGIKLHRKIDEFTDHHPTVKKCIEILKPYQGKYSSVILDIYFDYFLAKNWNRFSEISLKDFSKDVYTDFNKNIRVFPDKVIPAINSLTTKNWFEHYQNYEGINNAFIHIEKRVNFENNIKNALANLKELDEVLEKEFLIFFPDLINAAKQFISIYDNTMKHIKTEIKDGVGTITLNRPEVYNSFNIPMALEVQAAFDEFEKNKEVRAIVLTAEGKGFCAGQDLKEATEENAPSIEHIVNTTYNPIIKRIRNIEKPVIGAVNGVAAGAGANIAMACDITFASHRASFIQSFSNIGLIPDSGGTFFLPRLIGMQRATAHMFLGNKFSAEKAQELGMIYEVVEAEKLQNTVFEFAKILAQKPTKGFGLTKRALNKAMFNDLETQLDVERDIQAIAGKTYDNKEGINAFLEKRKPIFKGE
jgi:2-(1,2-epoxy-1,2-dihydrophenyl)acetyl-CoA isomerase